MPRNKWFVICVVICLYFLLAACSASPEDMQPMETVLTPVDNQEAVSQPEDTFEVVAWVDNPTPAQGEQVNLSGSLIKNGVYLGGMMMHAAWPDKDQEHGVPNCKVLVIYQRGICIIDTKDFNPGEYVPVTVKFVYNDRTFTGETGFTVK